MAMLKFQQQITLQSYDPSEIIFIYYFVIIIISSIIINYYFLFVVLRADAFL